MATPYLELLHHRLSKHLEQIARRFTKPVKLTLVIRQPEVEGDAGIVISDDDYDLAIAEIKRQRATGTLTGKGSR
jgi:hypothetical protein